MNSAYSKYTQNQIPPVRSSYKWVARSTRNGTCQNYFTSKFATPTNTRTSLVWKRPQQLNQDHQHHRQNYHDGQDRRHSNYANVRKVSPSNTGAVRIVRNSPASSKGNFHIIQGANLRVTTADRSDSKSIGVRKVSVCYDPNLRTLVKTINLRSSPPGSSVPDNKASKAVVNQKHRSNGHVSRFKIVRNGSSSRRSSDQKKATETKGRSVTNIISKYKIRRRSFSSPNASSKLRRFNIATGRGYGFGRWLNTNVKISRYSLIKRVPKTIGKNAYKIDRQHERRLKMAKWNVFWSQLLQQSAKRRWITNLTQSKFDANNQRTKHCLFYIRYGRCCRGDACQFVHDPEKIVVCSRFLRGTCKVQNCSFSHVVSRDKMPLCRFFLLGKCIRSDCPYLHVKHPSTASLCSDFERGFCPKGAKCDKKHERRNGKMKKARKIVRRVDDGKETRNSPIARRAKSQERPITTMETKEQEKVDDDDDKCTDALVDPLPDFIPLVKSSK